MEFSALSASTIVAGVYAIAAGIVSALLVLAIRLSRRELLSDATCWALLATTLVAPSLGAFHTVRRTMAAFGFMTNAGGGVAYVAASLWEALQPTLWSLYLSIAILTLCTLMLFLPRTVTVDASEHRASNRGRIAPSLLLLLAFVAAAAAFIAFISVEDFTMVIIDPKSPPDLQVADASKTISSRLITGAVAGMVGMLCALASGLIFALRSLAGSRASRMTLVAAMLIMMTSTLLELHCARRLSQQLRATAVTGQVQSSKH
jgi:hypothetical protein